MPNWPFVFREVTYELRPTTVGREGDEDLYEVWSPPGLGDPHGYQVGNVTVKKRAAVKGHSRTGGANVGVIDEAARVLQVLADRPFFEGAQYKMNSKRCTLPEPGSTCEVHRVHPTLARIGEIHSWDADDGTLREVGFAPDEHGGDSVKADNARTLRALAKSYSFR